MTKARDTLDAYLDYGGAGPWEREHKLFPDRRFRCDMAQVDLRICVEYDGMNGSAHGSVNGMMRDSEKGNLAQLAGWLLIRVNAKTIRTGEAFTWIEQAIALRRDAATAAAAPEDQP